MAGVATKSIPLDAWPETDRRQWETNTTVKDWPLRHRQRIARAYGRWLKWQGSVACDEATVCAFEASLAAEVSDASVVSYLTDLYYALSVLRPSCDWTWLRQRNHQLRLQVVPKRERKKRPGARRARLSVPFEGWPPEAQRQWQAAFAVDDRLADLKRRIAGAGRSRRRQESTEASPGPDQRPFTEVGQKPKRRGVGRKPPTSWSEAYRSRIQRGFGLWLGWRQTPEFADALPDPDRVSDYVEQLEGPERDCAPATVASYVGELHVAVTLLWPEEEWDWLGHDVELLKSKAEPTAVRFEFAGQGAWH